ncbi:SfnB family sulfur acquisition oxidoreductase [Erwiniaceae bacterium BAC15a-03b]|uniref:SfnB family sulfur acquisition oxidoreductase n=1 Tax=Winslowiella arboricola TaxID=2978220 RepID=A0A9J6PVK9_9GAMM|nr:SfnB family sulfur acquisition oxidoreductase [Winslowiella arboricola]MCU5772473.1 SfnB family sulfur acquisition oxidoreductase [Winslowiella arboricola]MCU5779733.1 SfnB family sulfur acquisition oxidoreductase [Winslowiella arboricola]
MSHIASILPEPAQVIFSDEQAIRAAHTVAGLALSEAVIRDRERLYPLEALSLFSRSGLGSISVPRAFGGGGLSYRTVAEVFRIISAADPSLGQIPQNHFGIIQFLLDEGSPQQQQTLFTAVVEGQRLGNGGPEKNTRHSREVLARLHSTEQGLRLSGEKFYSTGALFAHIVVTSAIDDRGQAVMTFVPRLAPGLDIIDDWSGIGQRTTASGTVRLQEVAVDAGLVIPLPAVDKPSLRGPVSQLIQAAIDAGIARGAFDEACEFVRQHSRPWIDAGVERNADDPHLQADIGRVYVELSAADALLRRAARTLDGIDVASLNAESAARASIAVAEAKVLTTQVALKASEKLLEWGGSRATLSEHGLDRHWRNARTHTLHDPVRWKYHAIGNYYLNGIFPARHAWI